MTTVKTTLLLSLYVQILTTFLGFVGLLYDVAKKDKILKTILGLETIVQIIELIFYIWFSYFYTKNLDRVDIAKYRYYDWVFTTPMMLLSTIMYFEYNNYNSNKNSIDQNTDNKNSENQYLTANKFIKNNANNIRDVFFYNFCMLLMGYLNEIGIINVWIAVIIGFVFFYLSFSLIYNKYAIKSQINMNIFYVLTFLWASYGIAALLPFKLKNICYNILDIFSKNFYGLFIVYIIYTKRVK